MRKADTKVGKIIEEYGDSRFNTAILTNILYYGLENLQKFSDDEINKIIRDSNPFDKNAYKIFKCCKVISKECSEDDVIEYIKMLLKYEKWKLYDYFDVWGNEDDGWEINNLCCVEDEIMISTDSSDEEILQNLLKWGYMSGYKKDEIEIEDLGEIIDFFLKENLYPLMSLRREII